MARSTLGRLALVSCLWVMLPSTSRAEDPPEPAPEINPRAPGGLNVVSVQLGGQIEVAQYRNGFQLGGGYHRWLTSGLWLDLGTTVLVHRNTNWGLNGGVRWKFARTKSGIEGFVRAVAEFAILAEDETQFVFGTRVGGGAAYYSSPGFGATLEGNISVGPSFGAGSHVASSIEILAGVEFPF